jgi:3-oxoacyl-[acyl-carrier protein] reductase
MKRLKNKTAVITGSSRGLGRRIAMKFANEGANVVINYYQDNKAANELYKQIRKVNKNVIVIKSDVAKRDDVRIMFNETISKFNTIDILINNAGINKRGFFEEITDEDWDLILKTNLKSVFICCQEVFPIMKKYGGRIINISSAASQYHGPKTVHYAVSKAGVNSLTKVLARYGAEYNILVNAIAPGVILTDQTKDEINSPAGKTYLDMTLLKRYGNPDDVTNTCLFLASDDQNYITGQVINVSGGAVL